MIFFLSDLPRKEAPVFQTKLRERCRERMPPIFFPPLSSAVRTFTGAQCLHSVSFFVLPRGRQEFGASEAQYAFKVRYLNVEIYWYDDTGPCSKWFETFLRNDFQARLF